MFAKILIANRGEIACRVIDTARRLGVATVAVYSEADTDARHVALADEAFCIGPAAARESYLNIERVIDAANRSGADAIHPGYGFLSENAHFATACADAGLVFIGPPSDAIRAMGLKSAAKDIMERAGVPVVPGYHGQDQSDATLASEAQRIGYPVMLKASAGGGGKGMRIVAAAEKFAAALESTRREAGAAFGNADLLLEKYLERPRHIEVQVFADMHGNAVHLFERDCSVQRRHQKVIEEAPAPHVTPERRDAMGAAAVRAAQAVGYVGAGTVEFIVDRDGDFYFMEMNTRLQVEHPVTEMITGQDLVEWQLRIAAGEALPLAQDRIPLQGYAIEARIYAEDPARGFLPSTGRLVHLRFPENDTGLRVDTGVREGDVVSVHYDPMIAKLIVVAPDRERAVAGLARALRETQVVGVTTNIDYLVRLVAQPQFAAATIDTGYLDREADAVDLSPPVPSPAALAMATLAVLGEQGKAACAAAGVSADPYSPWHATTSWRLNGDGLQMVRFRIAGGERVVRVRRRRDGVLLDIDGRCLAADGRQAADGTLVASVDGERLRATAVHNGNRLTLFCRGERHEFEMYRADAVDAGQAHDDSGLIAPMPGRIVEVFVAAGGEVSKGDPLLVLEAMKMEHTIVAPADGTVASIAHAAGELVDEGTPLLVIE